MMPAGKYLKYRYQKQIDALDMLKVNNNDSRMMINRSHCFVIIDKFGHIQNHFSTLFSVITNFQHNTCLLR